MKKKNKQPDRTTPPTKSNYTCGQFVENKGFYCCMKCKKCKPISDICTITGKISNIKSNNSKPLENDVLEKARWEIINFKLQR